MAAADEYLLELGRIAANWGYLESWLNMCLQKLAGVNDFDDPTAFILIAHTNFPQRLDMLGALCQHLSSMHPHLCAYDKVIRFAEVRTETPQQIYAQRHGER